VRLCATWSGVFFLLLSLSQGDRVMRYLLPLYPPLAVLAARSLLTALDAPRRLRATAVVSLLLGVPLLAATAWIFSVRGAGETRLYLSGVLPSLVLFSLALTAFAVMVLRGLARRAVAALTIGALLSYGLTLWVIMTRWEQTWPWRTVGVTVNRLYRPGDRVLVAGGSGPETTFASYWIEAPVEAVADDATLLGAWQAGRVFGIISPEVSSRLAGRLQPVVLIRTPLGWSLVTNR
jgi:hypothetical protein